MAKPKKAVKKAKAKVKAKAKPSSTATSSKRASTARSARRAGTPGAAAAPRTARGKSTPRAASRTSKLGAKRSAARAPAAPAVSAVSAAAPHDELPPPRDIPRLTRYGERFGPHKIDTRMLPQLLPIGSSALALFDPAVPESWRVLDRPVGGGNSRVMLSVARGEDRERAAALVVYVGPTQIARWTVARHRGQEPPGSADALPRCPVTSGWLAIADAGDGPPGALEVPAAQGGVAQGGVAPAELSLPDGRRAIAVPCGKGEYAAYWAVDAADKPVCLVVDLDVFTQKEWRARPTPA